MPTMAMVHADRHIQSLIDGFIKKEMEWAAKIGTPIDKKINLPR
jgi:hypothetical protein